MRIILRALCCALLLSGIVFAQSDRGTITGTITDPAGAIAPGAAIKAKNTGTGIEYSTVSTNTGNYTLAQLPVGSYELTVSMTGFKTYVRQGINVLSAQTLRIDVPLEVGSISESVTVSADAPLLKTDSTEVSHNVSVDQLNTLPVLGIGSGVGLSPR